MSFQVLDKYSQLFPGQSALIGSFRNYFNDKLWNQLSMAILTFLFNPQIKGKVSFDFYTQFVKRFQKNIDPIKLLKVIKQVIISLPQKQRLDFLRHFQQKQAFTQQTKAVIQSLEGLVLVTVDFNQCSDLIHKIQKTLSSRKDVDPLVYSTYYEFCMSFYKNKSKYRNFYTSALQFLAYTPVQQMSESGKVRMLVEMAVAALVSGEIYNFSQLLEQPSLVSLKNSGESWMYELLEIFNKGDIARYERFDLSKNDILVKNKSTLEQKIRIMKFLEIVFNLPKSDRVIRFTTVAKECAVPEDHVEFMIMKAMALGLIKGSIDQLNQDVTVTWVAPKVLESERIEVMLRKFQEWDQGVQNVYTQIKSNLKL